MVHILLKPESPYLTLNMILFLLCHITSHMVMRDRELHAKRTASTNHLNLERKHEYMLSSTGEERLKIAGSCEIAQGRGHRAMRVRVRSLQWEVTHLVREGKRNDFICVFKRSPQVLGFEWAAVVGYQITSEQISRSVMSDSLSPHE